MNKAGFYWVRCTDETCCPDKEKGEVAFFLAGENGGTWLRICDTTRYPAGAFEALKAIEPDWKIPSEMPAPKRKILERPYGNSIG